jgi:hypothetical protein
VNRRMRIQIKGRDTFWGQAFHVEWQDQFADRKLLEDGAGYYLADEAWLDDLQSVGRQTFCEIRRAPDNPQRRDWLSSILSRRK